MFCSWIKRSFRSKRSKTSNSRVKHFGDFVSNFFFSNSRANSFWYFFYLVLVNSAQHWQAHTWSTVFRHTEALERVQGREWSISPLRKAWELGLFGLKKLGRETCQCQYKYLREGWKKDRARLVSVVPSHRTRGDNHTLNHRL